MRNAYLLLIYKDFKITNITIDLLDSPNSDIFIHVDKKSESFDQKNIIVPKYSKLYFIDRMVVNWAGDSNIKAIYKLIKKAKSVGHYDYYHLMMGDVPIKNQDYINDFLMKNGEVEYINCYPSKNTSSRFRYYRFFADAIGQYGKFHPLYDLEQKSLKFQKSVGVDRIAKSGMIPYKGSALFSITDDFVQYLLENESLVREYFYNGIAAEEHYIQTLMKNSKFSDKIYGRHMRYILWESETSPHPHTWNCSDLELLKKSDNLFARKFSTEIDYKAVCEIANLVKTGDYTKDYYNNKVFYDSKTVDEYITNAVTNEYSLIIVTNGSDHYPEIIINDEIYDMNDHPILVVESGKKISTSSDQLFTITISDIEYEVIRNKYVDEFNSNTVFLKANNEYWSMEYNQGLNIFLIDKNKIIDSVCFGGLGYEDILRRPELTASQTLLAKLDCPAI